MSASKINKKLVRANLPIKQERLLLLQTPKLHKVQMKNMLTSRKLEPFLESTHNLLLLNLLLDMRKYPERPEEINLVYFRPAQTYNNGEGGYG